MLIPGLFPLQVNKNNQKVPVTMVNTSGALLEGLTSPTVEITKNGASFATPSLGTFTEISDGDYTVTLNSNDCDTVGWLILRVKHSTSEETKVYCTVGIDPAEEVGISTRVRRTYREGVS